MSGFESKKGGVPFPRTAAEWTEKANPATGTYYTPAEAEHKVAKDVFGHDHTVDASGAPVERGKGSAAQPTAQHQEALMISQEAKIARRMRLGWHPGMDGAFDPKQAEIERLTAELAKAKKRKPAKAKKAARVEENA